MSRKIVYVVYHSQYLEAVKANNLNFCIKTYEVDLDDADIKDFYVNTSVLHNCSDLLTSAFHNKINLKPFEIEAYIDFDKALSELKKYAPSTCGSCNG